ncbi:urease accessory protein UreD [Streptomyces laculatispora]|uniref:Urease accessory protein UreD n=1 Tax=Streptomyces laculatispora TaxID=887464 RepID=A0ABY9IG31_9ACTN|nr:urease accessory protein UreD [Streptomyces laculatispora]WLQ44521.1 urease accessory protein UreD [Streptomyces laculatispora]
MSVRATARVTAVRDRRGATSLPVLESEGPLALRRTRAVSPGSARVTVVGAMSAPLGGDRLAIEVRADPGARLAVDSAAATLALPGPGPGTGPARYEVRLSAGEGAELSWLPEQLISAHGSELITRTTAELAPTARLVLREEQILGRHGESPGTLLSRLTVRRAGRPLLDQQVAYGPGAPGGWDGPAVLGGHRAVGQLLVVEPSFDDRSPEGRLLGPTAVLTRLAGPAVLVTAVAADARELRAVLDRAHDELTAAAAD